MVQPHSIIDIPDEGTQLEPVAGGSGTLYLTLAAALAGEIALGETDRITGLVPQAGTAAGSLVGPGSLSAVNDFYKDYYVLNTDTTPTNGLVSQWARVSSYDGATRTLTLDKPWDFSAESTFVLLKPAYLTLLKPGHAEDFTASSAVVLNLGGNRLEGKIDCTGEEFHWIQNGYVTNGIQKTVFGLLKVDDCTVSRRDATIYALLMTEGSDLGRCELQNVRFMGRVAGRRGFSGWTIQLCKNVGVPTNSGFDNFPFTLVESVGAVTITLSAFDLEVDSEFGGSFLYTENNITGATAYMSAIGTLKTPENYFDSEPTPRNFFVARASGGGVLNVTHTAGRNNVELSGYRAPATLVNNQPQCGVVAVESGTAAVTFNESATDTFSCIGAPAFNFVYIEGAADTSGTITLGGASSYNVNTPNASVTFVRLQGRLTGTINISNSASQTIVGGGIVQILYNVNQNAGAPSITISSPFTHRKGNTFQHISQAAGLTISVGTTVISGAGFCEESNMAGTTWGGAFTGGTFTISAAYEQNLFSSNVGANFTLLTYSGNGTTVTLSGNYTVSKPERGPTTATFRFLDAAATSGTITTSGTIVFWGMGCTGLSSLVRSTISAGTAAVTGAVSFIYCSFEGNLHTIVSATVVGAVVQGPSSIDYNFCYFGNALTTQLATGTVTWTGATLRFRHCYIEGLYTVVYTAFTTHEAFHSHFNGNSSNKSISGSGTRPTTLRYYDCSALARYDDILPDWLVVYDVLPAQAALVRGQPVKINAANQYQVCVAASIVEGTCVDAPGAGGTKVIVVKQGRAFLAAKAGTVNGDNLALDLVTPTQYNTAPFTPGQNGGTALENVGTTIAGLAYSAVNAR